jgi:hypothetical protein
VKREHPARVECGVELAATEFPPSYRRGTIMQVTLAAVCLLSSIASWLAGATFWWLVAGVLQVSVIPFTLIVILPTNKQLLNPALDKRSAKAGQLLARWGKLHAVRSVLSVWRSYSSSTSQFSQNWFNRRVIVVTARCS